jgi:Putative esterase
VKLIQTAVDIMLYRSRMLNEMFSMPAQRFFQSASCLTTVAIALSLAANAQPQTSAPEAKGTTEKIKVHGKSLEGNLEGDSPDRDVFVYLPPSYAKQTGRRYPVVYFLHGYTVGAETYWKMMCGAKRAIYSSQG